MLFDSTNDMEKIIEGFSSFWSREFRAILVSYICLPYLSMVTFSTQTLKSDWLPFYPLYTCGSTLRLSFFHYFTLFSYSLIDNLHIITYFWCTFKLFYTIILIYGLITLMHTTFLTHEYTHNKHKLAFNILQ